MFTRPAPHQWVRRRPPSPPTVFVLPTAAPSPERLLHAPGIFLARVDHVSSFRLFPPCLAAFLAAPASPTGKRPTSGRASLSHTTRGGSHSPPLIWASVVGYFPVFLLCFVLGLPVVIYLCLSMYWCLSYSDSLYILYHLNWWPQFLVSVS
jgi:hypothetical protein